MPNIGYVQLGILQHNCANVFDVARSARDHFVDNQVFRRSKPNVYGSGLANREARHGVSFIRGIRENEIYSNATCAVLAREHHGLLREVTGILDQQLPAGMRGDGKQIVEAINVHPQGNVDVARECGSPCTSTA